MAAAAIAGVALLGLGAHDAMERRAAIAHEQARLSLLHATTATLASTSLGVVPRDVGNLRAAARFAAQSRHPWGELFAAIESAAPADVQWLSLDHASDSAEVHLEGIAVDVERALGTVDALAAQSGWTSAALTRLSAPDSPNASAGMRFEITAQWRADDKSDLHDFDGVRTGTAASLPSHSLAPAAPVSDVVTLATSSAPIASRRVPARPTPASEPGGAR